MRITKKMMVTVIVALILVVTALMYQFTGVRIKARKMQR